MRETNEQGVFWKWGHFIYRYRRVVFGVWCAVFIGMGIFAVQAPSMLKDNGFTPVGSESDRGLKLMQEQLQIAPVMLDIVYESSNGESLLSESNRTEIMVSLQTLRETSYVSNVSFRDVGRSEARNDVTVVTVTMNLEADEAIEKFASIRNLIPDPPNMKAYVTGNSAVFYDVQEASKRDIIKSEIIGLPIALIVLLLVFGTWLAGVLPLVVGMLSVTTTLGIIYFIALGTNSLSNFLPNMVSMLGLAVGIDYALFMVSRFREELATQSDVGQAVAMTAQKAGKSIFFSGVAVLIGLIAMAFIDLALFRSLALGGVLVVSMSVIVGNTLLLALLGMLGERINRYSVIPKRWRNRRKKPNRNGDGSSFWGRVAYGVMKRPIPIVLLLCTALIACVWPILNMNIGIPDAKMLPPKYESRYGSDLMTEVYDERELNPIQLIVKSVQPFHEERTIETVSKLTESLKGVQGVQRVDSYLTALSDLPNAQAKSQALQNEQLQQQLKASHLVNDSYMLLSVVSNVSADGEEAYELVRNLRSLESAELDILVTGTAAYRLDIVERITSALPYVVLFILAVTYVVLFIAFRSVILPLKAVFMNVLSLGASLGVVVLVFQHGYMADLLQVTSTGVVVAMLPVIIFCVVFGISMDYEVFLLSRIAEEYERTGDNERSTAEGLKKTGSIITSAAFILIVVVGAFIFTDNELMKAIGLGLSVSVLLDATLIRLFLVPALMKLMGRANWWAPRWAKFASSKDTVE
ncbi:MMPL family transporter [Paenibacillus assamensis]|uniref:MMPL family transporter n=1 Tax=Paenibacillus assamensis TaxID=311244 RepID=UPI0004183BF9|nr:MMPL family transporter [Paenibacillus assamensis]